MHNFKSNEEVNEKVKKNSLLSENEAHVVISVGRRAAEYDGSLD